jgi:hypothetical protein
MEEALLVRFFPVTKFKTPKMSVVFLAGLLLRSSLSPPQPLFLVLDVNIDLGVKFGISSHASYRNWHSSLHSSTHRRMLPMDSNRRFAMLHLLATHFRFVFVLDFPLVEFD